MATTLKSDYEVAIRFKDGGNIEKYVPLEDLNSYISTEETADLSALTARAVALEAKVGDYDPTTRTIAEVLTAQGMAQKLEAISARADSIVETLENKLIRSPVFNDAMGTQASFTIGLAATPGNLTVKVIAPGTAGNSYSAQVQIAVDQSSDSITVSWASPNLIINIESTAHVSTVTAYELVREIETNYPEVLTELLFDYATGDANKVVEAASLDYFSGGTDTGAALTATSAEIDATVSAVASYTPSSINLGKDMSTLWTDVEAAGTGLKAVVGTYAGAADIASDLSAAEGDIDDLEAIAAETGAPTMAVAATLTTGAGDSELLWTAQTKGEDGDDLGVQFTVPQTELVVTPTGGITAELEYTGVKGQHPISITYSAGGADHAVAIGVVSKDITLTIGSLCTADELWAAIKPAGAVHGDIDELIANIAKTANWGDGTTVVGTFAKDYLDSTGETVTVTDGAIEIECEYDGATDLLTTTANDIITAIEAHTGEGETFANNLVTVVATGAGTDVVAEMEAHSHLAGGVDGTAATAGKIRYTADAIWVATSECTVSDSSGWKSAALS